MVISKQLMDSTQMYADKSLLLEYFLKILSWDNVQMKAQLEPKKA
jgi:hypothetical protein